MVKQEIIFTAKGGRRRTVVIAATAGNVVKNMTPEAGKRWVILRGIIILVTDATVANRQVKLQLTDGTNVTESLAIGNAHVASLTRPTNLGEARNVVGGLLGNGDNRYIGIDPILLENPDQFRITIQAGVAGDSYSGFLVVIEIDM